MLAIADAAPHHTMFVHLEGGKGGGHHSWEELDELLLETYHDLRRRPTCCSASAAGSAPGARRRPAHGAWSLAHGELAMPVDAVLLGHRGDGLRRGGGLAGGEERARGGGRQRGWVRAARRVGGVTSARSRLGADIHLLDNAAARAGHLVEEVAGDAALVAARRDELVAALAAPPSRTSATSRR